MSYMIYGENLSQQSGYSTGEIKKNLMSYLPIYYNGNNIMTNIQNSISIELDELEVLTTDTLQQLFVETATWGLKLWETELGIPTDTNKSEETRRTSIMAKIRGVGVTTPKALEDLAELFSGGQALVYEFPDEYKFIVKFIGVRGIPSNIEGLTAAIEDIKPAHLTFGYKYTYLIWYEAATYLWDEAGEMTWDRFRVAKPKHFRDPKGFNTWSDIYCMKEIPLWKSLRTISWEEIKRIELIDKGGF